MAKAPQTPNQPLSHILSFKVNERMLAVLDDLRGPSSRADYLRDLIRSEYRRRRRARQGGAD